MVCIDVSWDNSEDVFLSLSVQTVIKETIKVEPWLTHMTNCEHYGTHICLGRRRIDVASLTKHPPATISNWDDFICSAGNLFGKYTFFVFNEESGKSKDDEYSVLGFGVTWTILFAVLSWFMCVWRRNLRMFTTQVFIVLWSNSVYAFSVVFGISSADFTSLSLSQLLFFFSVPVESVLFVYHFKTNCNRIYCFHCNKVWRLLITFIVFQKKSESIILFLDCLEHTAHYMF